VGACPLFKSRYIDRSNLKMFNFTAFGGIAAACLRNAMMRRANTSLSEASLSIALTVQPVPTWDLFSMPMCRERDSIIGFIPPAKAVHSNAWPSIRSIPVCLVTFRLGRPSPNPPGCCADTALQAQCHQYPHCLNSERRFCPSAASSITKARHPTTIRMMRRARRHPYPEVSLESSQRSSRRTWPQSDV
jgi:hypothetical protein